MLYRLLESYFMVQFVNEWPQTEIEWTWKWGYRFSLVVKRKRFPLSSHAAGNNALTISHDDAPPLKRSSCYFSGIMKGYVCFVVSIFVIGVVTAIIGDVASHFGATLGIADSVTAIVFVALGTSIPGEIVRNVN